MTAFEIPFVPSKPQTVTVSLVGVFYRFTVRWNQPANCWMLDIADSSGDDLATGIAMITGTDLLGPYKYLDIGGQLIAQTDHDTFAVPTFDNLGDTGHLYFVTDP